MTCHCSSCERLRKITENTMKLRLNSLYGKQPMFQGHKFMDYDTRIKLQADESERIGPMSASLWCNINDVETNQTYQIGHAFSEADEDREHYTKTRTVEVPTGNSYGRATYQERQEVSETIDVCGYHARKQAGLTQNAITVTAEDIDTVEEGATQAEADMWRARYEAEKARRKADI